MIRRLRNYLGFELLGLGLLVMPKGPGKARLEAAIQGTYEDRVARVLAHDYEEHGRRLERLRKNLPSKDRNHAD